MTKRMNEYVLMLNPTAGFALNHGEEYQAGAQAEVFRGSLSKWLKDQQAAEDVIRTEAGTTQMRGEPAVSIVCTEDIARRVVEAFHGKVANYWMSKENVVTIPAPVAKKARRPGFGSQP
jgi:hypothetical protein